MESAQVVEAISLLTPKHALASATLCGATLYVGGEDGSLRVHASREDPLASARQALAFEAGAPQPAPPGKTTFEAGAVLQQFSKRREPVLGLCAVPEWRALFSQTDGCVMVHALQDLARAGFALPGSAGCRAYCASATAGLVLVAQRSSFSVHAWAEAPSAGPPSAQCLRRVSVHSLARPTDAPSDLCITSITACSGGLVCVAVVHASALGLAGLLESSIGEGSGEEAGSSSSSGEPVSAAAAAAANVNLPSLFQPFGGRGEGDAEASGSRGSTASSGGGSGGGAAAAPSPASGSDTGYSLTYLLVHAFTGTLVRLVRAGAAPPLDAAGALVTPAAAGAAGEGAAEAPLRAMDALLRSLDVPAAAAPMAAASQQRFSWGACTPSRCWRGGQAPTLVVSAILPTAGVGSDSMASLAFEVALEGSASSAAAEAVAAAAAAAAGAGVGVRRCRCCGARVPLDGCICHDEPLQGTALQQEQQQGSPLMLLESLPFRLLASPSQPLIFAAHPGGVLVFSACSSRPLLQEFSLPGVLSLELVCTPPTAGAAPPLQHHLLVTARTGVVLLKAFPLIMQVAALHSSRPPHFHTALAMCGGGSSSSEEGVGSMGVPASRMQAIRAQHGYSLFQIGEFEGALKELALARVPAAHVLALYPHLLPSAQAGEGGPSLAPPSHLPLPPSQLPKSPSAAPSKGGRADDHMPDLGRGSADLLPKALAALTVYLARQLHQQQQQQQQPCALGLQLLEGLLWLRNFHRVKGHLAETARLQAAVQWCLRGERGARLPVEGARALLVSYGLALGAGGAQALELAALYTCHGLLGAALEVLALEVQSSSEGGEGEDEEGGSEQAGGLLPALQELKGQLVSSVAELTRRGEVGAAEDLQQRVLTPLLAGGGGLQGTLLALHHCMHAPLPVPLVLQMLDGLALHAGGNSISSSSSSPKHAALWLINGRTCSATEVCSSASGEEEGEDGAGAAASAEYASIDASMLPLTGATWLRLVRMAYLEHVVFSTGSSAGSSSSSSGGTAGAPAPSLPALASALASHYLDTLAEAARGLAVVFTPRVSEEAPGLVQGYRQRLLALLHHPHLLHGAAGAASQAQLLQLQRMGGRAGLLEERIAVLGHLGRHAEALRGALGSLGDWGMAEAYCARAGGAGEAYAALAAVAVEVGGVGGDDGGEAGPAASSTTLPPALMPILTAAAGAVQASAVLAQLPSSTPLAALAPFCEAALGAAVAAGRLAAAERSTGGVAHTRARRDLVRAREKRYRVVDRQDVCGVCGRRLGVAAGGGGGGGEAMRPSPLAILPNGAKVHLACMPGGGKGAQ